MILSKSCSEQLARLNNIIIDNLKTCAENIFYETRKTVYDQSVLDVASTTDLQSEYEKGYRAFDNGMDRIKGYFLKDR